MSFNQLYPVHVARSYLSVATQTKQNRNFLQDYNNMVKSRYSVQYYGEVVKALECKP